MLIGNGPDLEVARQLAKELNIEEKVLMLGNQKHIAELLSMSDLMLLVSEKESFGLVALEAMACGVPVIGTHAGGIPEVVVDGETGYLCEVGDVDCIADKAIELLTDHDRYERFSTSGMKRVKDVFCSKLIVAEYERLYEQMLSHSKKK